jgi:hypothetical protein
LSVARVGAEILDAVFMKFTSRGYRKREDGPAIARACGPPLEIRDRFAEFMPD